MNRVIFTLILSFISLFAYSAAYSACDLNKKLGVSRTIEIDSKNGPLYGRYSYPQTLPLRKKEVVLTFDDGPHPIYTMEVLKVLKDHCTKATFFSVGSMAEESPETLKAIAKAGHTIGAHSQTHPKMTFIPFPNAKVEIEKSFHEIIKAVGKPIAPFFRYPGLRNSKLMDAYMKKRGIAVLSVDVVSGDTRNKNTKSILKQTLGILKRRGRGIILLHDIQATTAEALPKLLEELKKGGYKVVHVVSKRKMKTTKYKEVLRELFIAQSKKNSPETVADIMQSAPATEEKSKPVKVSAHKEKDKKAKVVDKKASDKADKKSEEPKEQQVASLSTGTEKPGPISAKKPEIVEKKEAVKAEVQNDQVADITEKKAATPEIQNEGLEIVENVVSADEDLTVQTFRKKKVWDEVSGALASFFGN